MSFDVEINIFGRAKDPEAIWELANAAVAEGRNDYIFSFDHLEFTRLLEEAARQERPLTLTNSDTKELFPDVTKCCQEAGLSYVVLYGSHGEEGFSDGFSWRPGMPEERGFLVHGTSVALKAEDVVIAARQGIEAVNTLIHETVSCAKAGKLEVDADVIEALRNNCGAPRP